MNNTYNLEVKEFTCPFCDYKESLTINIEKLDKEGLLKSMIGIDSWDCPQCGAENDIGLENFEEDFKIFKEFTEINDFRGLFKFCKENKFDDFILYSLGKYYIQRKEFEKALNIGKILLEINKEDICAKEDLIIPCENVLKLKGNKNN